MGGRVIDDKPVTSFAAKCGPEQATVSCVEHVSAGAQIDIAVNLTAIVNDIASSGSSAIKSSARRYCRICFLKACQQIGTYKKVRRGLVEKLAESNQVGIYRTTDNGVWGCGTAEGRGHSERPRNERRVR
jgi:hypothetical protein